MNRCLALVVMLLALVVCSLAQTRRKPEKKVVVPEVDLDCMECICQASSDCDQTKKCHNDAGYFCGPYAISWPYWHDAGRPGDKGRAHDFETCLNNKTCAEEAVRGYMRKNGQDCDQSGTIDCYDFARIHKLGYRACGDKAFYNTDFGQKFEVCYNPPAYDPERHDTASQGYEYYGEGAIQARQGNLG